MLLLADSSRRGPRFGSPDVEWQIPTTELALGSRLYEAWTPGTPIPDGLAEKIAAKVEALRFPATRPTETDPTQPSASAPT